MRLATFDLRLATLTLCTSLVLLSLGLHSCQDTPMVSAPDDQQGSSMLIPAPYVEPLLDWHNDYKTVLNHMADRGFSVMQVTENRVDYALGESERASVFFNDERDYVGASVDVISYTVSHQQVKQWLGQQYIWVQHTDYPQPEDFYRSKVATDSILVSYTIQEGRPHVEYSRN